MLVLNFYIFCILLLSILFIIARVKNQKELLSRVMTLAALLTVFCSALWAGKVAVTILLSLLLIVGVYELAKIYPVNPIVVLVLFTVSGLLFYLKPELLKYSLLAYIPVSIYTFTGKSEIISAKGYMYIFSLLFIAPCAISLMLLYSVKGEILISLILLLQFNDAFGYIGGKKFGKTKTFKSISPNKSFEGYIFSALGIVAAIILLHTAIPVFKGNPFLLDIMVFGIIYFFGNTGDLLFSSLKRKLKIKDFGNILPGHGGVLDRMDNMLFTAPVYFLLFGNIVF